MANSWSTRCSSRPPVDPKRWWSDARNFPSTLASPHKPLFYHVIIVIYIHIYTYIYLDIQKLHFFWSGLKSSERPKIEQLLILPSVSHIWKEQKYDTKWRRKDAKDQFFDTKTVSLNPSKNCEMTLPWCQSLTGPSSVEGMSCGSL